MTSKGNAACAFTGHRPSKFPWRYDETDSRCKALKTALAEQVSALVSLGVTDYFSGMADGSDLWLSQIVLDLRKNDSTLKLHCALPCEKQSESWSRSAQERYSNILKQADFITYVSHDYHKNCMMERNRFMVDQASILLAVCINPDVRRSGTAATVRYARKAGKKIILLNPLTLNVIYENSILPR